MFQPLRLIPVVFAVAVGFTANADAAVMQQLSMDQMTQSASAIVRARVTGSSASIYTTGGSSTIYTHYRLAVSEIWKGSTAVEVMLPGGDFNGQKQSFPGVPELKIGGEYVLFLWKSPSTGIVHTIGLTQGIFEVAAKSDGTVHASRRVSGEVMLDATGHRVADQAIDLKLSDMKTRVSPGASK